MFAAKVILKDAEKVKTYLLKHTLLHPEYLLVKELGSLYFPLQKKAKVPHATIVQPKFPFPARPKTLSFEEAVKPLLTSPEFSLLPKSQEIVGKILILEIPFELQSKEKAIAEAYLRTHPQIETVVKKEQLHEGTFRTRKVRILAGKMSKETIHKESGINLKLHLERTYFSARSANERLRLAKLIKKNEEILVMFSGAGPYPLVLGRNSPAKKIVGIELNPWAHQFALENIASNNLAGKVAVYEGDVRDLVPKMGIFDRIIMPLPKTGEEFLSVALPKVKKKGFVHLYSFLQEDEFKSYGKKIKELCAKLKYPIQVKKIVKCGQFSPGVFRVCFDLQVGE